MRWKNPKQGDRSTVTKFLLIPVTIGDETRWLEKATIERICKPFYFEDTVFMDWVNLRFVNP